MLNTPVQDYLGCCIFCAMSLFTSYTPRFLYKETLSLVNVMFHCPQNIIADESKSYFQAVLHVHQLIRKDLNDILKEDEAPSKDTTVEQVHASLVKLEKQLFGTESEFTVDIKGCCIYTRALQERLSETSRCCIV